MKHLPTNLSGARPLTSHYYGAKLLGNCLWGSLDGLFKEQVGSAFSLIRQEAALVKEEEDEGLQLKKERNLKCRDRTVGYLGKFFNKWRLNSACLGLAAQNQQFIQENSMGNDCKIIENMLRLPVLILML